MNPPSHRFDRDTSIHPLGSGRYSVSIDRGWWVVRGPNGGYIAAILQRAVMAASGDQDRAPRSLTIHYTSPPSEGPAEITTQVEREGRSLTTVTARMTQGGKLRALAVAALSKPREGHEFAHMAMPTVPGPDELPPAQPDIPASQRYEFRLVPFQEPHSEFKEAVTAAWIRLAEPRELDAPLLAAYADALPPPIFSLAESRDEIGPVPTVDLTVHYRTEPTRAIVGASDFCLGIFRTRLAHAGYVEEDGEIWSPDGSLLVQSRQLAVTLES
ncbi:MAG: thioesterase family protein [Myxococcota bacterium]|nr:thioesterase family protein [Myxococcota bacterium]